jgi:surfactin synthase thioesterase subunit
MIANAPSWLLRSANYRASVSKLFCFPFAGGGASVFRPWMTQFPSDIEICAVQLPGRESRLREQPHENMAELVPAVTDGILPHLQGSFSFFGYSMGALVAFEVVRRLQKIGHNIPDALIVAASPAPQVPRKPPLDFELPDDQLIRDLQNLQGTPAEVLGDRDLMRILLPAIRSDVKVVATYVYEIGKAVDCPIAAIGGSDDSCVSAEHLDAWRFQTTGRFARYMLTGKHFFLLESPQNVMHMVLAFLRVHSTLTKRSRLQHAAMPKRPTERDHF